MMLYGSIGLAILTALVLALPRIMIWEKEEKRCERPGLIAGITVAFFALLWPMFVLGVVLGAVKIVRSVRR